MADESRSSRLGGLIAALAVTVVATVFAIYKARIAIGVGQGWDTYAFLGNAAAFAGKGIGYTEPHRPPMLSFITSLWFRVAPLDQAAIQWVDAALTVSGVLAFYLLLRKRTPVLMASAGALTLLAVTPLWDYLGVGYTDTAAIALSLWTLLALIAALEDDPRWFLAVGPLFMAAAMTRFTVLLFGFPLAVLLLLRWRPFRQARHLVGAAGAAIATYVPFGMYYGRLFGEALFPFIVALGISEGVEANPTGEGAASGQVMYYVKHALDLTGPRTLVVLTGLLCLLALYGLVGAFSSYVRESPRPRKRSVFVVVVAVALALYAQFNLGMIARQVTIPLAVLALYRFLGPAEEGSSPRRATAASAIDAAMLTWLLTYLDFHGHQTIQVPRYFIPMAPGLIYFVIRGIDWLIESGSTGLAHLTDRISSKGPAVVLGSLVLTASAALLVVQATVTPREPDPFVAGAQQAATWMEKHDTSLADRTIVSDLWPLMSWYLKTSVRPMPSFEDKAAFAHELDKTDARYFVTLRARRYDAYTEQLDTGHVAVLERTGMPPASLPRIAYLGSSWDSYLEQMTGYPFYLDSTAGRYGYEGSAFLDAYSAEELRRWDAVAVAGFKWKSHANGENTLREYVEDGGVAVIDASQNLGGLAFSVVDTIMLDTVVRRTTVPADAAIESSPAFAARHPEASAVVASPFVDETGGVWAGASYEARPGLPALETLVSVGGKPAVQLQRLGKGRIYWIGSNLVWHAFYTENRGEADLVNAVFAEALGPDPQSGLTQE